MPSDVEETEYRGKFVDFLKFDRALFWMGRREVALLRKIDLITVIGRPKRHFIWLFASEMQVDVCGNKAFGFSEGLLKKICVSIFLGGRNYKRGSASQRQEWDASC